MPWNLKGLIRRSPNKSRAVELTESIDRSQHSYMAGLVATGPTTLAFEQAESIDFGEMLFREDRFSLRVSGDSMIEAQIADGDCIGDPGRVYRRSWPDGRRSDPGR